MSYIVFAHPLTCSSVMPIPPFNDFMWCSCCKRHVYIGPYGLLMGG